jgi:hypothetical protein
MTFEVLTSISITEFGDAAPCSLIGKYQHFGGTCCLHLQGGRMNMYTDSGGSRFLPNVGTYLQNCTASHPECRHFEVGN